MLDTSTDKWHVCTKITYSGPMSANKRCLRIIIVGNQIYWLELAFWGQGCQNPITKLLVGYGWKEDDASSRFLVGNINEGEGCLNTGPSSLYPACKSEPPPRRARLFQPHPPFHRSKISVSLERNPTGNFIYPFFLSLVSITCAPNVPHRYFWRGAPAQVNDKTSSRTRQRPF